MISAYGFDTLVNGEALAERTHRLRVSVLFALEDGLLYFAGFDGAVALCHDGLGKHPHDGLWRVLGGHVDALLIHVLSEPHDIVRYRVAFAQFVGDGVVLVHLERPQQTQRGGGANKHEAKECKEYDEVVVHLAPRHNEVGEDDPEDDPEHAQQGVETFKHLHALRDTGVSAGFEKAGEVGFYVVLLGNKRTEAGKPKPRLKIASPIGAGYIDDLLQPHAGRAARATRHVSYCVDVAFDRVGFIAKAA